MKTNVSMISRALNALGLMKRSEHSELMDAYRSDWQDILDRQRERFKLAATDLAKQAEEITELKMRLHYAEPRAIKWDNSLKRSRNRKAAKNRGGGK